jgi:hypothetical protein
VNDASEELCARRYCRGAAHSNSEPSEKDKILAKVIAKMEKEKSKDQPKPEWRCIRCARHNPGKKKKCPRPNCPGVRPDENGHVPYIEDKEAKSKKGKGKDKDKDKAKDKKGERKRESGA